MTQALLFVGLAAAALMFADAAPPAVNGLLLLILAGIILTNSSKWPALLKPAAK